MRGNNRTSQLQNGLNERSYLWQNSVDFPHHGPCITYSTPNSFKKKSHCWTQTQGGHLEISYNSKCRVWRETAFGSQLLGMQNSCAQGSSQGPCSSVLRTEVQKTTKLSGATVLKTGVKTWGLEGESFIRSNDFPYMQREMVPLQPLSFFFNLLEIIFFPR